MVWTQDPAPFLNLVTYSSSHFLFFHLQGVPKVRPTPANFWANWARVMKLWESSYLNRDHLLGGSKFWSPLRGGAGGPQLFFSNGNPYLVISHLKEHKKLRILAQTADQYLNFWPSYDRWNVQFDLFSKNHISGSNYRKEKIKRENLLNCNHFQVKITEITSN